MTDLCFLSVEELGQRLRRREVSPVELAQAHLDRIGELNAQLVAYVYVDGERALAAARAAEIEIGQDGYRGPLHGLPIAYKDIVDVQSLPTSASSRVLSQNVATADSTVAAKLRQAGAICLGKLNTTEFASGDMAVHGEARNPWDTARTTGGSSSGPAGAVAARLAPLAIGTDTGGSVRIPSSFCGIAGLRPTHGRVSQQGIVPLSWSHDQAGPMARSVADLALLLADLAGPGVDDRTAQPAAVPNYRALLTEDIRGVRLGVPRTYFFDDVDPEVRKGVEDALSTLRALGATVVDIDLPYVEFGRAAQWALAYSESYVLHRRGFIEHASEYGASFFHKIAGAAFLTAEELVIAQRLRRAITDGFLDALQRVDAIITPTSGYPANRVGEPYPSGDTATFTRPISLTGLPALSVPCGLTSTGLPMGMQIVGRAWDEPGVLRIGYAYECARGPLPSLPSLQKGTSTPSSGNASTHRGATQYGPEWILEAARLNGVPFVHQGDAAPIAASIGPIKERLAQGWTSQERSAEPRIPAI